MQPRYFTDRDLWDIIISTDAQLYGQRPQVDVCARGVRTESRKRWSCSVAALLINENLSIYISIHYSETYDIEMISINDLPCRL